MNHVTWESLGNGVWPVPGEVLYREECAQSVLIFVNYEQWRDEPDTEIVLVTNDGVEVKWLPLTDEYGISIVPTGENYLPMLMDFGIWGYVTGWTTPRTGSRPGTTGGCRPQTGGWLTQIGPASSGIWSSAGATATRTIPDASISTISRRMGRSMRTRIPASGVWRATACIWTSRTARAPA